MNPYLASTEIIDWQTPEIYAQPLPVVVETLSKYTTRNAVLANLPDA